MMVQGSCRLPCFAALRGGVKSPVRTAWGGRHQGVRAIDDLHHRVAFVTTIPQSVHRGSGCYVGIQTLATGVRALGVHVQMITPTVPVGRYLFNQALRWRRWDYDAVIGFDLDGFDLPRLGRPPHIANKRAGKPSTPDVRIWSSRSASTARTVCESCMECGVQLRLCLS